MSEKGVERDATWERTIQPEEEEMVRVPEDWAVAVGAKRTGRRDRRGSMLLEVEVCWWVEDLPLKRRTKKGSFTTDQSGGQRA